MPKDPKGDKHPAKANGSAIQVGPIAKVEGDGKPADAPNGANAGGAEPAKSTTSARRKEIDKAAASPRWEG